MNAHGYTSVKTGYVGRIIPRASTTTANGW